jgi:undecaprenyl-diphosphatase
MNFIQSAILGLVQGLTEFIPVSSTGHLLVVRKIMGLDLVGSLSFDAILQLATGLAVLVYFYKDILNIFTSKNWKLIGVLVAGTIPAIILGLLLQDYMDTVFRGTGVVAVALILGAGLFYWAEKKGARGKLSSFNGGSNHSESFPRTPDVSLSQSLKVGLFQCLALIPGFSRSGSTISGGLLSGLNRETAVRFSFLLSLPIIFGSGLYKVYDQVHHGVLHNIETSLIIASIFAFISGLLAIHYLLKFLKNHSLNWFGLYRLILAIIILFFV